MTTTSNTNGLLVVGVPPLPFWLTILRGAIVVLALGVLIAAAYNLSLFGGYASYLSHYSGPAGFFIFNVIKTWLILGFMLASEFFLPQLYFRLAFVLSLTVSAILWLSNWAWAASVASDYYSYYDGYGDHTLSAYGGSLAAATALGAVIWVLIIVFLVFFVRASLANAEGSRTTPHHPNDTAELGEAKPAQTQPTYVQNQQTYPQPQQTYNQPVAA